MGKDKQELVDFLEIDNKEEVVKEISLDVTNPFNSGITYEMFLEALPKDVTIEEYLKDKCTLEEIEWLKIELNHYNKNKK